MSKMNKYIIIFLALLIACMSISTAADIDNSTDETSVSADVPAASVDVQTHSASDNNVIKNNKNLKSENEYDGITITQSNYNTYFDSNGNTTSQLDGHTKIRFSGELNIDQSLIIDRALNITSTEDGIIKLNTVAGSLYGSDSGNSFTINEGGSNSNITGLKFYNTQVFVKNAENVVLNGINVTVENQTIGSGVGVTSIRDGSSNVTVKNSYFYTKNNGGSSTLVLAGASYSTLDNNTMLVVEM